MKTDKQTQFLLQEWELVHRRSQLSLWILLSISSEKLFAAQINSKIVELTNDTFELKEQSLYRALRRFRSMGIIDSYKEPSPNSGADRIYYQLNAKGKKLMREFIRRNISPYYTDETKKIIKDLERNQDS